MGKAFGAEINFVRWMDIETELWLKMQILYFIFTFYFPINDHLHTFVPLSMLLAHLTSFLSRAFFLPLSLYETERIDLKMFLLSFCNLNSVNSQLAFKAEAQPRNTTLFPVWFFTIKRPTMSHSLTILGLSMICLSICFMVPTLSLSITLCSY